MAAQQPFEKDVIPTSMGDLAITFLGHGTLMMTINDRVIHVDPYSRVADYNTLPKADVVLITHEHRDHLDPEALKQIRTADTEIILTEICDRQVEGGTVLRHGETESLDGVTVEAVPAYNIQHKRDNGQPFHPKGAGNGYVLTFGDTRVYVAGDTEKIPEMAELTDIDVAFLPMNLPYTMTPEMVADAARSFQPRILYPYHFGSTDTAKLEALLADTDIDVRIRSMA
jgi:L-ascorbate metabolism protein UlaG (beta-lactamase superfamily)